MSRATPEVTEERWAERSRHRLAGVQTVRSQLPYVRSLLWASVDARAERTRPLTPDHFDRSVTKRQWEKQLQQWRQSVAEHSACDDAPWPCDVPMAEASARRRDDCLVRALSSHGFPMTPSREPGRGVVSHANKMMEPLHCHLVLVTWFAHSRGRYLLATPQHVLAVCLDGNGLAFELQLDAHPTELDIGIYAENAEAILFRIERGLALLSENSMENREEETLIQRHD